jgi:methyl-accepting chemotaxis protein
VNEIKINTHSLNLSAIVGFLLLIAVICAGVIYYYRGASGNLDKELDNLEKLNHQLVSETRELQTGLASHSARISSVTARIETSKKRIEHIYFEIEQSAKDASDAVRIIDQCQEILETVKTQR